MDQKSFFWGEIEKKVFLLICYFFLILSHVNATGYLFVVSWMLFTHIDVSAVEMLVLEANYPVSTEDV